MRRSTANLRAERAKHCVYASWMECMVGLIAVIINGGTKLPALNDLHVFHALGGANLSVVECRALVGIATDIWVALQKINIPMPQANPDAARFLLRHVVIVV